MSKDRNERPANARAALECVTRLIDGRGAQPQAKSTQSTSPTSKPPTAPVTKVPAAGPGQPTNPPARTANAPQSDGLTATTLPEAGKAPGVGAKPPTALAVKPQDDSVSSSFTAATAMPDVKIDPQQLALLAKRIIVDQNGMRAALALAPGANFPRWMLDQILTAAGIIHGIEAASLHTATFPKDIARRLILARGTPPSPGVPGRGVRGEPTPPLEVSVTIQVPEDAMQAVAFTRPGQLARRADLEQAVKATGLRFGLDAEALRRLVDGPPFAGGRVVVARGRPIDPGRGPGFVLTGDVANTTIDMLAAGNLRRVEANELVAWWDEGIQPHKGMDVLGRDSRTPPFVAVTPEQCIGTGTELARESDGRLAVRARVAGFVQRQLDGTVRVVGIFSVDGDLGPEHPPIETTDVVVIRGSVRAGAKIYTSSDVVIMGDLENASINAGGNLEISGQINEGEPIAVAGTVAASSSSSRTIMAGSVRIDGEIRDCELRATGDVRVRRIIGGSVIAGGDVRADVVGDSDGTTTMLWAGRHLTNTELGKLAQLTAARCDAERAVLMHERQIAVEDFSRLQSSNKRMQNSSYVNQEAADQLQDRLRRLEDAATRALAADERARELLSASRQDAQRATEKGVNARARIEVGVVANTGAILRLADASAEALREPRLKLKLGI